MRCTKCKQKAVFLKPTLCKRHFLSYIEKKVAVSIKKYKLIAKKDKLVVAVSGGKDSLTTLYLMQKYTNNLVALCIDEGIKGYRNVTIQDMVSFCKQHNIEYIVVGFKDEFGFTLDEMTKKLKEKPCTICGVFRRYLLNKKARELNATKLVTGHNMDDECQAIFMNLAKHQIGLLPKLGPITGTATDKHFIPRVKPLYFLSEREIAAYVFLKGFNIAYKECPYATTAYRADVGTFLNDIETKYTGTKKRMIMKFVSHLPDIRKRFMQKTPLRYCNKCDEPSSGAYCKACYLQKEIK